MSIFQGYRPYLSLLILNTASRQIVGNKITEKGCYRCFEILEKYILSSLTRMKVYNNHNIRMMNKNYFNQDILI